jgi:uncharacterized protein DUF29
MSDLYETDLAVWADEQAALLRRLAAGERVNDGELDWIGLAEEIEAVSARERRELRRRLARLMQHLLKYHYQIEHRSRSWRVTILEQRDAIAELLADNASLRRKLPDYLTDAYPLARRWAEEETGLLNLPDTSPFTLDQVIAQDLPD